jgi:hypothetical protein
VNDAVITRPRGRLWLAAGAFLLLPLVLPACNNKNNTTSASGIEAALALTIVPNPVVAMNTLNPTIADYDIRWMVTITETAGVGGDVQFVKATLFDPSTGLEAAQPTLLDSSDLLVIEGTNHLNPKGSLTVSQQLSYRLASRGRAALLSIAVEMKDDNGNLIDQSTLVQVQ